MRKHFTSLFLGILANGLVAWPIAGAIHASRISHRMFAGLEWVVIAPLIWIVAMVCALLGLSSLPDKRKPSVSKETRIYALVLCSVPLIILAVIFLLLMLLLVTNAWSGVWYEA